MDYEYWLRFGNDMRFVYIDEPIANYRLHASSKTIHDTVKMMKEMVAVKKNRGWGRAPTGYIGISLFGGGTTTGQNDYFSIGWQKKSETQIIEMP